MHLFPYWNLQLTWVDMLIWSNILLESCLKWGEGWFDYIQNRYRDSLHSKSLLAMCSSVLVFGGQAVQGCWHHLGAWIRLWWNIYIYICFFLFVMSLLVSYETQNGGVTSSAHTPNIMLTELDLCCKAKKEYTTTLLLFSWQPCLSFMYGHWLKELLSRAWLSCLK